MYVIELHDNEIHNQAQGTRAGTIGRQGSIEYPYQVEMFVQDVLDRNWRRAYVKIFNNVVAIFARDVVTGSVSYLFRAKEYGGEWQLPFVTSPDAQVAVANWGADVKTDHEAAAWATQSLTGNVITAVVLDHDDIRAAWELVNGSPQLISRGPSK